MRYRKKVEKDESYMYTIQQLAVVRFINVQLSAVDQTTPYMTMSGNLQAHSIVSHLYCRRWNIVFDKIIASISTKNTFLTWLLIPQRNIHLQKPSTYSGPAFLSSVSNRQTLLKMLGNTGKKLFSSFEFLDRNREVRCSFFRDPNTVKRTATHMSWFPDGPRKLAIAYCNLHFQGAALETCMDSYIWEIGAFLT